MTLYSAKKKVLNTVSMYLVEMMVTEMIMVFIHML